MTLALVQDQPEAQPRIAFTVCPLCFSPNFQPHASADCSRHHLYTPLIPAKIQWMRCDDCEHVFTDGYFTEEQSAALFAKAHSFQLPGQNDIERMRLISARIVERVSQHVQSGRWLDVGFGDGSLLMTAQEFGFDPVGIDIRQEPVDKLRAIGISAHRGNFLWDAVNYFPDQFDVISMADVLEHIPQPRMALKIANHLLSEGGILFVSCPNMDTIAWRELTKVHANPYWVEIEHFSNFTRKRLWALLIECGFEPKSYAVSERYRLGGEFIARKCGASK